nr:putative reverse transcriptase domain-containing protein [Tanacetum cinerariifolium]
SPIAQSPEYVPESNLEAHPEDDDDEDPVDYLADGGNDGDDEEESSEDDEMDIEDDEEEEEEHPAPADTVVIASTAADQAPSAEETEPFETDESAATPLPHPAYRMIARISIPAPVPMPAWIDSEIVRLLAISSPPASPLSPWSSPSPQILFPPLPPILSPPSPLPSASRREDRPEVTLPPQKRLGIALGPRYEVGESSSAAAARPAGGRRADYGFVATMDREIMRDPEKEVGYGITNSWDEILETLQGEPVSIDTELSGYVREFETRVRQDTNEIYMRLDDEQTERQLLAGRLNMLFRDRRVHAYTRHLMEIEARMSREAWVRVTDASDLVCGEVMSLRTTVLSQMSEIRELQAADRRRQTMISELLRTDHRRSTEITELRTALQGHLTALQGQVTALQAQVTALQGQQGLAGGPTQPELPEEAGGRPGKINTTSATNAQLQAMIDKGVTAALAVRDALRSTNGDDSHNSGIGAPKELPVFPNGVKEWSPSFTSTTALPKIKSSLLRALFILGTANTNNANNQRGTGLGQRPACYECGAQGHFKRECPKLKNNNNHGNQGGRNNAPARGNETLIIHGDSSNQGNATRLSIISCTKTEKYVNKGFPIFLPHITTKEVEDKSKKKRLEDVPIVRDFPEVFPEELTVPGAALVARAPYRLAPSEMKELAEQLKELSEKGFIRPSSSP